MSSVEIGLIKKADLLVSYACVIFLSSAHLHEKQDSATICQLLFAKWRSSNALTAKQGS